MVQDTDSSSVTGGKYTSVSGLTFADIAALNSASGPNPLWVITKYGYAHQPNVNYPATGTIDSGFTNADFVETTDPNGIKHKTWLDSRGARRTSSTTRPRGARMPIRRGPTTSRAT